MPPRPPSIAPALPGLFTGDTMNAHDADKLLGLVQGIWLHVETYHLPHSEELRRSFRYGNTDHVIHSTDSGIGGAIAKLCEYLDANMERIAGIEDLPTDEIK